MCSLLGIQLEKQAVAVFLHDGVSLNKPLSISVPSLPGDSTWKQVAISDQMYIKAGESSVKFKIDAKSFQGFLSMRSAGEVRTWGRTHALI